jgi:hypothetical protein
MVGERLSREWVAAATAVPSPRLLLRWIFL